MLDEQDAAPSLGDHPFEQLPEALGLLLVEAGRRLVEQEDVERSGQATSQFDQASLTGRQRTGLEIDEVGDPAQLQRLFRGEVADADL